MTLDLILADAQLLDVKFHLDLITGDMNLLPPKVEHEAVKRQIQALARQCAENRHELRIHLAPKCRQCKRPVWCREDRERLAEVNPYCREAACPLRRRGV